MISLLGQRAGGQLGNAVLEAAVADVSPVDGRGRLQACKVLLGAGGWRCAWAVLETERRNRVQRDLTVLVAPYCLHRICHTLIDAAGLVELLALGRDQAPERDLAVGHAGGRGVSKDSLALYLLKFVIVHVA